MALNKIPVQGYPFSGSIKRQVWLRSGPGDGQRTEVEYWPPGWDDTGVIWPEDAFDPEDAEDASAG